MDRLLLLLLVQIKIVSKMFYQFPPYVMLMLFVIRKEMRWNHIPSNKFQLFEQHELIINRQILNRVSLSSDSLLFIQSTMNRY